MVHGIIYCVLNETKNSRDQTKPAYSG